jgi:hypothetical protein
MYLHALFCAGEHIAAGPHCTANKDGLSGQLIVDRDEGMVRRKRAC